MSNPFDAVFQTQQQLEAIATELGQNVGQLSQKVIEDSTQETGKTLDAFAHHPFVQWVSQLPGASRLLTFLGQVDVNKIEIEITQLQSEHPLDSPKEIADRVIQQTALQAGTVGLLTNLAPPLALSLFAVDLAATTRLQAEMVYRIAGAYGFPLTDPARRGEVLAIFGLSMVGSGVLKTGASFIEVIPLFGAVSGAAVNATLLFALGQTACEYYEAKQPPASKAVVVYDPI